MIGFRILDKDEPEKKKDRPVAVDQSTSSLLEDIGLTCLVQDGTFISFNSTLAETRDEIQILNDEIEVLDY